MARSVSSRSVLLGVAAALVTSPATAQLPGTVEVGLFGQRTAFDHLTTLTFGTAPGLGGLLGVYVFPNLAVEAGTSFTWTHPSAPPRIRATWVPLRVRAVYNVPATETFYPLVGVGVVRNSYSDAVNGSDTGVTALVGFKTYLRDRVAFRSELHLDRVGTPFNLGDMVDGVSVTGHTNWNLTAGISLDVGGGRFRDTDLDRVRDRLDLCPETPRGVGVDPTGCRLDEDGDLVFDEDDECPLTPPGVAVDSVGCRVDDDRDGVFNEDDLCLSTPAGVTVDGVGCAVDTDQDTVADYRDECSETPLGVRVDQVGCRLDTDEDGVFDEDDLCPDTPRGTEVDGSGCRVLFEEEAVFLVLEGVTFETASSDLTAEARIVLDGIASALLQAEEIRVRVNGHTDSTGARAFNVTLSQNRAESVVTYLASRGVAVERMEAQGFGPDEPVASNDTAEGRRQNRRVELERIG